MDRLTYFRVDRTLFRELCRVRAGVLIQKPKKKWTITHCCKKLKVVSSLVYMMLMRLSIFLSSTYRDLHYFRVFCQGDIKPKQQVIAFHSCNADGSDKLTPLVIGKYWSPYCCKDSNINKYNIKYEANTNSWMTTKIFEDYLTQLDRKLGVKIHKILLFIDQQALYP
jgi:hypothetical protein